MKLKINAMQYLIFGTITIFGTNFKCNIIFKKLYNIQIFKAVINPIIDLLLRHSSSFYRKIKDTLIIYL